MPHGQLILSTTPLYLFVEHNNVGLSLMYCGRICGWNRKLFAYTIQEYTYSTPWEIEIEIDKEKMKCSMSVQIEGLYIRENLKALIFISIQIVNLAWGILILV